VLPIRPGHGATGGSYLEDQGGCENADYFKAGLASAASIEATLEYMATQPFLKRGQVVVIGQSAGGWAALALASRNPPAVRAVINFSGGRGGRSLDEPNANCAADRLIAAAGEFGRTARVPTLWIYAENDSYFGPALSKRMADAFRAAGGRVEFQLLPPVGEEGHLVMLDPEATRIWGPTVEKFLAKAR
jgi:dienelactone hydrolase